MNIAREKYTRWRDGAQDKHAHHVADAFYGMSLHADAVSAVSPSSSSHSGLAQALGMPPDPFATAHPSLVTQLRETTSSAHTYGGAGVVLPPMRSATLHSNTMGMQSYSTSAERTGGGYDMAYSAPGTSESMAAQWVNSAFLDSTWMTWF